MLTKESLATNYFYKTELIKFCRQYGLPTTGTKAELTTYLRLFLNGQPASTIKPMGKRKPHTSRSLTANEITLETKLIDPRFFFNDEARQFFANYYGLNHFSFNKEMAVIRRNAIRQQDETLTVHDLIVKLNQLSKHPELKKQLIKTPEEKTYQWNQFVKDFFSDPQSHQFKQPLKIAGILWQRVKKQPGTKKYQPNLLTPSLIQQLKLSSKESSLGKNNCSIK